MPRVARALQEKGFKIIKVKPNDKKPQYSVYMFEDTPAFQEALSEILSNR
jgi:predicted CoA-binding protein